MNAPAPDEESLPGIAQVPVLVAGPLEAVLLDGAGEAHRLSHAAAARRLGASPHLLCHAPQLARRLGLASVSGLDLLELHLFVRPARPLLPTVDSLAAVLGLPVPGLDAVAQAHSLRAAAVRLLADLGAETCAFARGVGAIAQAMDRAGWSWAPHVLAALGPRADRAGGLAVWQGLKEWQDSAPPPPPSDHPVAEDDAGRRLAGLLGSDAETREAQRAYARAATWAFRPRQQAGAPNAILLEAGTGTGKTLGYIAPASLWAERNGGPVWLSTYTRNLQRQLDAELARLYPDPKERADRVVVRKGRENYACLLNIEEAARAVFGGTAPSRDAVMVGLVLRWLGATRDGDMVGGDFPSWLATWFGAARLAALTDHRGECIYSACMHYRRCFIEKAARRTRRATLVVANHALVMSQAALRRGDPDLPRRLVFDEGHHLFDAADSAFSAHLTGQEGAELRRWLRGRETGARSRQRGLLNRLEDLLSGDETAWPLLQQVLDAARALPGPGWSARLTGGMPQGPFERFLEAMRDHVLARAGDRNGPYGLECGTESPAPALLDTAARLGTALGTLAQPLSALVVRLTALLDEQAAELDSGARGRLEASARALLLRAELAGSWVHMLGDLGSGPPDGLVDWFALERLGGREVDLGLHRHWIDPTKPFAEAVLEPAHGVAITSATLLDRRAAEDAGDWQRAETRVGAGHLVLPAKRFSAPSPFDYAAQTRVMIVTDIARASPDQVAAAFRELFLASGGGALGLFTAIARLRGVHARIAPALGEAGLTLLAQHVDAVDTGTLVDIFRADEHACLLGTDAVRDGVDVPGNALRLIVFDRVPWPRPTVLHRARRAAFGGAAYDDLLTRLRLAQGFGRLIRRAGDRGVFVMLDAQTPTRLLDAFPPGVEVERVGLARAVEAVRGFVGGERVRGGP